jgi:hypothetical protein
MRLATKRGHGARIRPRSLSPRVQLQSPPISVRETIKIKLTEIGITLGIQQPRY